MHTGVDIWADTAYIVVVKLKHPPRDSLAGTQAPRASLPAGLSHLWRMSAPKLRIIIDGGYLFNVFQPYRDLGYRYSAKRMARLLALNHDLQGVHYVDSINQRDPAIKKKQETYYEMLKDRFGWDVTILPLQYPGGVATQKGTDTAVTP